MRTTLIVFVVISLIAQFSFAEEPTAQPPWLQPDVLRAAGAIELTDEQLPQFRTAVTDLVNNHTVAINKLLRGNNVSNLKRKLKTATNRQFKKMDKSVAGFLSAEQYPKYEQYRKLLKLHMADGARTRSGSSGDAFNTANSALHGNSNTQ
jgi:hypothetical protein